MTTLVPFLSPIQQEKALALLDDAAKAKLALLTSEVQSIAENLSPAETQLHAHKLSEVLSRASVAAKELDAARRKRVDPLNDEVRQVNGIFKVVTAHLDEIERKGKSYLLAWTQKERARVQREQDEADRLQRVAAEKEAEAVRKAQDATSEPERLLALAEAEKASLEQARALVGAPGEAPRAFRDDIGTNSTRKTWDFEVVSLADVPRGFLMVNDSAIRGAIAAGVRQIDGISIFEDEQITTRVSR